MSEYTPTDALIRNGYLYVDKEPGEDPSVVEGRKAEFDRWLEQHDMEVREETRQEAYHDGYLRGFEDGYGQGFAAHDFYDDWIYNAEDNE